MNRYERNKFERKVELNRRIVNYFKAEGVEVPIGDMFRTSGGVGNITTDDFMKHLNIRPNSKDVFFEFRIVNNDIGYDIHFSKVSIISNDSVTIDLTSLGSETKIDTIISKTCGKPVQINLGTESTINSIPMYDSMLIFRGHPTVLSCEHPPTDVVAFTIGSGRRKFLICNVCIKSMSRCATQFASEVRVAESTVHIQDIRNRSIGYTNCQLVIENTLQWLQFTNENILCSDCTFVFDMASCMEKGSSAFEEIDVSIPNTSHLKISGSLKVRIKNKHLCKTVDSQLGDVRRPIKMGLHTTGKNIDIEGVDYIDTTWVRHIENSRIVNCIRLRGSNIMKQTIISDSVIENITTIDGVLLLLNNEINTDSREIRFENSSLMVHSDIDKLAPYEVRKLDGRYIYAEKVSQFESFLTKVQPLRLFLDPYEISDFIEEEDVAIALNEIQEKENDENYTSQ